MSMRKLVRDHVPVLWGNNDSNLKVEAPVDPQQVCSLLVRATFLDTPHEPLHTYPVVSH